MKLKPILAGLMSACMIGTAAAISTTASAASGDFVYGDANCDGSVKMSDAVLIMQSLSNASRFGTEGTDPTHITEEGEDRADVADRGNGITAMDALSIQRYLLGMITELPESVSPGHSTTTTTTVTTTTEQTTSTTTTEPVITVPKEDVDTKIHLNGYSISVDGKYASVDGTKVTISHSGTYTIDGTLNDGQIYVEIPDENADPDTVKLVLSGANITGKSAPAILVKNADKTSVTVSDGTENTISDSENAYP